MCNDNQKNLFWEKSRYTSFSDTALPDWAIRRSNGELEIGLQLFTKDGSRIGNAVIEGYSVKVYGIPERPSQTIFSVRTDFGNEVRLTENEIYELFEAGFFIVHPTRNCREPREITLRKYPMYAINAMKHRNAAIDECAAVLSTMGFDVKFRVRGGDIGCPSNTEDTLKFLGLVPCCEITDEERDLLQSGDYNAHELFGTYGIKTCPLCHEVKTSKYHK